ELGSASSRDAPPSAAPSRDGSSRDDSSSDVLAVEAPPALEASALDTPALETPAPERPNPARSTASSEPEPAPASRPPAPPRTPSSSDVDSAPSTARTEARLTVNASAPSIVLLDGVPLGTTPLDSISVEPGSHEIVFFQNGKRSTQTLTIRSGEHKHVEARIDAPSGDGLNEAAVKRTIQANRDAVVDTCWEYAFGPRAPSAPTSVRVPVTISVDPSGAVRSVDTAAQPPGYPALRRCVEDRVSAWTFPDARADTIVNVAFVFAQR
ncbi:MAG TPA: hypothetical protein VMG12_11355, partial [Polyangiaceae bacterium]|nr:hypothetical protein [Polyangiaceae bacterium]